MNTKEAKEYAEDCRNQKEITKIILDRYRDKVVESGAYAYIIHPNEVSHPFFFHKDKDTLLEWIKKWNIANRNDPKNILSDSVIPCTKEIYDYRVQMLNGYGQKIVNGVVCAIVRYEADDE